MQWIQAHVKEVREGFVLSPHLFNIYSEMFWMNIEDQEAIKVGGQNMNNLRYADDNRLVVDSAEHPKYMNSQKWSKQTVLER